jgi:hypothetical protein
MSSQVAAGGSHGLSGPRAPGLGELPGAAQPKPGGEG